MADYRTAPSLKGSPSLLQVVNANRQVTLSWAVSAFVPVVVQQTGGEAAGKDAPKERQVLFDVEGVVKPGEILALMGPSGSGKSSLMSVLCGRTDARISGKVLFNGKPLSKSIKRSLGFVTQDDLLFAELTTLETLYYAAMLRLPREWSREKKLERVEMVLEGLGLSKCRDTIIGNHMMRGVSGGERKRVSIGHELLINPSILLLDEPTSGLDSTTALNVMQTLRGLASGGRTVIASIHQPSSRIYQEIDQLLLLSEGHTMYYGDAHCANQWFSLHGVAVPFGVSTADHLLDLANGDVPGKLPEEGKAIQTRLTQAFKTREIGRRAEGITAVDFDDGKKSPAELSGDSSEAGGSEGGLGLLTAPETAVAAYSGKPALGDASGMAERGEGGKGEAMVVLVLDGPGEGAARGGNSVIGNGGGRRGAPGRSFTAGTSHGEEEDAATDDKWGATWWEQVSVLTSRCLRVRRFSSLSVQHFAEVIIPAIMAGLFWFQLGGQQTLTQEDVTDLAGLLFFQILFNSFSSMFQSIFTFPADFAMLKKERASGMYRLTSYYMARTLSDIPMDCLIPSLFTIIIYWMSGLRISAGAFFANWASLLLSVLVAQSTGLLIGATVMNPRTAMAMATIYMLTIMLVSGYWVRNVPVWIGWLKYVSFIWWAFNLVQKIEFSDRGYSCVDYYESNPTAPPGLTWCSISSGDILSVDPDEPVWPNVLVLLGMLAALRVAVYYALRHHTNFKSASGGEGGALAWLNPARWWAAIKSAASFGGKKASA